MRLNALIIAILAIWSAAAIAQDTTPEREYILRDNGIRCTRAPCASMNATDVATGQSTAISGYDVSALGLNAAQREALGDDLYHGRLVVRGRVMDTGVRSNLVISRVLRRAPGAPAPRYRVPG